MIGVSYVNEGNSVGAMTALKSWARHNPLFQDVTGSGTASLEQDEYSDGTLLDEVMQMMLAVLKQHPRDADVHTVMGVLYNVSNNFPAAAEHFRQAVGERPNDYALLNKVRHVCLHSRNLVL